MEGRSRKIAVISLVVLILFLFGVVAFIAIRLQQSQAPTDSSASDATCSANPSYRQCQYSDGYRTGYVCKCVAVTGGTATNPNLVVNCAEYNAGECPPQNDTLKCPRGIDYSGDCGVSCPAGQRMEYKCDPGTGNETAQGCRYDTSCPTGSGGDGNKTTLTSCTATCTDVDGCNCPSGCANSTVGSGSQCGTSNPDTSCVITYEGTSIRFSAGCAGGQLQYFHTTYNGTDWNCPTALNGEARFTVSTGGGTYSANPQAGECRQLDHHFGSTDGSVGAGGVCDCKPPVVNPPVSVNSITCYKCTDRLDDQNICESITVTGTNQNPNPVCPAGTTTNSACEVAAGGACPVTTSENTTCYRCTTATTDGNACEAFTVTGTSCPTGSTISATACATVLTEGICPIDTPISYPELPDTAIISESFDKIILGLLFIIIGGLIYKYDIFGKASQYLYLAQKIDITEEAKLQAHKNKVKKLKKDRKTFEKKVSDKFESQ